MSSKVYPIEERPAWEENMGMELREDTPEVQNEPDLPPFPKDGIKLSVLRDLIERDEEKLEGLTTTQVCEKYIFPQTKDLKCSYIELQKHLGNHHLIGKPDFFISHAWRYQYKRVVEAIEAHVGTGNESDVFVWFDLCCNSQHDTSNRPMEWWKTTFLDAIRVIVAFGLLGPQR